MSWLPPLPVVRLVTGTDEHGLKMVQTRADRTGIYASLPTKCLHISVTCAGLNISYDAFVRTTEPRHYEASQKIWKAMEAATSISIATRAGIRFGTRLSTTIAS